MTRLEYIQIKSYLKVSHINNLLYYTILFLITLAIIATAETKTIAFNLSFIEQINFRLDHIAIGFFILSIIYQYWEYSQKKSELKKLKKEGIKINIAIRQLNL